jgi:hypothetical protein
MFDTYCNICLEQGNLVPATIELCIQREDDPEAVHYVRCCDRHKDQGRIMAELMKRNMSPAVVSSVLLNEEARREPCKGP